MESFFHSLKADVIHGRRFQTVSEASPAAASAMCGTTTIIGYIRHWTINRPLTMSDEQRRSWVSTKPRQDPGVRHAHARQEAPAFARRGLTLR